MFIKRIIEAEEIRDYLKKRNLMAQYLKAKRFLLEGHLKQADFKLRQPKQERVWYFRINKKYRALGFIQGKELRIVEIDDHQQS